MSNKKPNHFNESSNNNVGSYGTEKVTKDKFNESSNPSTNDTNTERRNN